MQTALDSLDLRADITELIRVVQSDLASLSLAYGSSSLVSASEIPVSIG